MGSGHCVFAAQREVCNVIRVKDVSVFLAFTTGYCRWLGSLHTRASLVSVSLEALYKELYSGLQLLWDG